MSNYREEILKELKKRTDISNSLKTVIMAQACQESNFGMAGVNTAGATYNFWGINYYNDEYTKLYDHIALPTKQYDAKTKKYVNTEEHFCKFKSIKEALDCLIHWYDRPKYAGIKDGNKDPWRVADMLQGKYATDPNYSKKLKNIIDEYSFKDEFFKDDYLICIGSFGVETYAVAFRDIFKSHYPQFAVNIQRVKVNREYTNRVIVSVNDNNIKLLENIQYFLVKE